MATLLSIVGCVGQPPDEATIGRASAQRILVVRQDRVAGVTAADLADVAVGDAGALADLFEVVPLADGIDPELLQGPTVELREGGWIEVYSFLDGIDGRNDGIHREDDEAYRLATVHEEPRPATLDRDPGSDLVALPGTADFERLQLLQHFAAAAHFYRRVGHEPGGVPVFIAPGGGVWRQGGYLRPQLEAVSDNAYFDEALRFFWIAPPGRSLERGAPVYWRWSVIVHEMGHQVVDEIVDLDRETYRADGLLSLRTANVYATLHEAVADVFAAAATANPDLLGTTERDLSSPKSYGDEMDRSLDRTAEEVDWAGLPGAHERGAVVAHALWRAGGSDPEMLARWALAALRRIRSLVDEAPVLGLGDVLEAFAWTAPEGRRAPFCTTLTDVRLVDFAGLPASCERR